MDDNTVFYVLLSVKLPLMCACNPSKTKQKKVNNCGGNEPSNDAFEESVVK